MSERSTPPFQARLHLTFIDGMRGCAASYIVLHHALHAYLVVPAALSQRLPSSPSWRLLLYLLGQGHAMVTIFITISGFCLMLPLARNGVKLKGGARRFYKGRIHRILPPYYITLAFSFLVEVLLIPSGQRLNFLSAPATRFSVVMHILLLHNLNLSTFYSINGPLWSIATECQIYLFFPLMVLGWKRLGPVRFLAITFVLSHIAFHLVGSRVPVNYFFIFALGMAAAMVTVQGKAERWLPLACCFGLIGFLLSAQGRFVVSDLCIGTFTASLMALLSAGKIAWLRKTLSMWLLAWVGSFSYSLYLIHSVLQEIYLSTRFSAAHAGKPEQAIILIFALTPVIYLVSYLFYLIAEKPFLNRRKQVVETPVVATSSQLPNSPRLEAQETLV